MRWDIFCKVIDNLGDIGVAWRLARQLVAEHGATVRLWVDEPAAFARLCPGVDPRRDSQVVPGWPGVEARRWTEPLPGVTPGDVVVEAFGCHLPEPFVAAMAARQPLPAWINLEYLSAEAWVEDCHGLPSPHPRLPLVKRFFYPGFTPRSGGLLREAGLLAQRRAFEADAVARAAAEARCGLPATRAGALRISLFCYPDAPLDDWLQALRTAATPTDLLVPDGLPATPLSMRLPGLPPAAPPSGAAADVAVIPVPFVPQPEYDLLLWLCDVNVVRGEDSFVRAQWAARPFIWHIYPQHDGVHLAKLEAFLARYLAGLDAQPAAAIRALMQAWNTGRGLTAAWHATLPWLPRWRAHAVAWADTLAAAPDLAARLVQTIAGRI